MSNNATQLAIPSDPAMSEDFKVGDILWVKEASDGQLKPRPILKIDEVSTNVRHPLTFSHYIVVDVVLASVNMYNERLLRCVTASLRSVYKMNPNLSNARFTKKMVTLWERVESYSVREKFNSLKTLNVNFLLVVHRQSHF